jgi:glycosyltransferase involved in cell wall biosynthesis
MSVAVSVVMPAHNEEPYLEEAVRSVVEGLRKRREPGDAPRPFEVIVVENGSSDQTVAVAKRLAGCTPELEVLSRPVADYGQALRAGFLAARGDLVVNFDVDFVDFAFLDTALGLVGGDRGDPVIVVGTKRGPGSDDHRSLGRRTVTAVFSAVLRYGFGLQVSDTHGVKLLRRAPLVPLVAACRFGGDIFDTELILRAQEAGWSVAEVGVTVSDQRPPRSSILARIPRSLLGLCQLRLQLGQERHRPA